ncbi:MAG: LytR C-terminal domain-containing protein [Micrococcales bacterium]
MAEKFPIDEFDLVSAPGGRHRQPRTSRARFLSFLGYALSAAVISSAGIAGLSLTALNSQLSGGTGVAQANNHDLDKFKASGLGVTVLDASNRNGLATKVAIQLADAGWNVQSAANLIVPTDPSAPAVPAGQPTPVPTLPKTVVYVSQDQLVSTAKEAVSGLGSFEVKVAATYPDPITIVLGNDFTVNKG